MSGMHVTLSGAKKKADCEEPDPCCSLIVTTLFSEHNLFRRLCDDILLTNQCLSVRDSVFQFLPVLVTPNGLCSTHKTWWRRQNVVTPSHTCCRGTLLIRLPLCVCPQVCPGRVRHPAPVSATPFYDREVPAVSSPAPVDGLWPSAMVCK